MKSKGIRILDKRDNIVSVELPDILQEIENGNSCYWAILYLDATGDLGQGHSMPEFEKKINESKDGLLLNWEDLKNLSNKLWDVTDITIIANKNKYKIRRHNEDKEMYEEYEIVIEMIDSGCWKVFSKDQKLICKLQEKFKEVETLSVSFEQ